MDSAKRYPFVCPACGEDDCETIDIDNEWDYTACKRRCLKCDHEWTDYLRTVYHGFSDETGDYDESGEPC